MSSAVLSAPAPPRTETVPRPKASIWATPWRRRKRPHGGPRRGRYACKNSPDALNPGEAVGLAAALPDPLDWSPRRPGPRLLARGAAIRANMQGVPMGLPLPCGAGRA
jgi:hypothetical protein